MGERAWKPEVGGVDEPVAEVLAAIREKFFDPTVVRVVDHHGELWFQDKLRVLITHPASGSLYATFSRGDLATPIVAAIAGAEAAEELVILARREGWAI